MLLRLLLLIRSGTGSRPKMRGEMLRDPGAGDRLLLLQVLKPSAVVPGSDAGEQGVKIHPEANLVDANPTTTIKPS